MPGFQTFFWGFLRLFVLAKLATSSIRVKVPVLGKVPSIVIELEKVLNHLRSVIQLT